MIYCPSLGTGTLTDDEGKYRLIIKRVVQNESLHARRDLGKGLSGGVGNILTEPVDMIWKYPGPVIPAMLARTEKSDVFEIHFQAFANKVLGSGQELCVGRTATYDKNLTGSALATDIHKSFKSSTPLIEPAPANRSGRSRKMMYQLSLKPSGHMILKPNLLETA